MRLERGSPAKRIRVPTTREGTVKHEILTLQNYACLEG